MTTLKNISLIIVDLTKTKNILIRDNKKLCRQNNLLYAMLTDAQRAAFNKEHKELSTDLLYKVSLKKLKNVKHDWGNELLNNVGDPPLEIL